MIGLWSKAPHGMKAAALIAIAAFFIKFDSSSYEASNGVITACSYTNIAGIIAAVAIVAGLVYAYADRRHQHENLRLPIKTFWIICAVLAAVATYHLLAGFGTVGGPCN